MPRSASLLLAVLIAVLLPGRPASAQFIDEHFAPVPAVPDSGTYPAAVQQAVLEGYRQLGEVASPADDIHLEAAAEAFERALDADPRAIHALNGMGIYELGKDEQWLVLLESLKKILNRDHISMAIDAFEKALAIDPGFHAARFNLALGYRQARGEENYRKAIAELERLLVDVPEFPQAGFLLAATYRDAGNLDLMAAAVESIPAGPALPAAGRQLLLAYALINAEQEAEGAQAYWAGLDAIATEHESELYWFDIRPIAGSESDAEFGSLDVEGRKQFLRDFWQRLADSSFVTLDDRVAEHYRRLEHAYRNFRLPLPERRHYSGAAAYVPAWQTGFDDRGVIYLRHGPPDDTASYAGPEVQQNVSWKYERPGGDPLVFHFVSDEDIGDYKLVRHLGDAIIHGASKMTGQTMLSQTCGINRGSTCDSYDVRILASDRSALRELYASRGVLDPYYNRASTSLDAQILQSEEVRLAADIDIGTTTSSYEPAAAGDLPAPVYPVPFKDPGGRTTVAFYYALPTAEISVLPHPGGGSQVDYRYQLVVSGPGEETAARQSDDVTVASSRPIPREAGVMLPGVNTVSIPPGEYRYGMKMTDLNSGRSGITNGSITVNDFNAAGLSLSGIVLASRVEPAADSDNPFVRWDRIKVLPLPSKTFLRSQPVFVYYEVYGLSGTQASYRTTYTLESREPDRNIVARFFSAVGELLTDDEEEGAITYSFERSLGEDIDPLLEYFSLDVSESPAGEYLLTVEVEDLATGERQRRQVPLTLVG
ncbi:MAG: GWxTD domain-containing protein [Gemmatimonadota bacterium]